jgi:hypothetical protein
MYGINAKKNTILGKRAKKNLKAIAALRIPKLFF